MKGSRSRRAAARVRYRTGKFIRRHRWGLAAAAVLVVTLVAGMAGVAWQARVANQERRKAEARSADLRQLSNSLLSELDEAIKQIPGSTGAQKLLVTSVLKHLDRMANDAHGDRQTQLDLANAYTQLANLQGNAYEQSLGDSAGAVVSIDKAIALSTPWARRNSQDHDAIHMLANAELSRGRVLFGTAPIQQAIDSTRAAIESYDRLIALRRRHSRRNMRSGSSRIQPWAMNWDSSLPKALTIWLAQTLRTGENSICTNGH